MPRQLHVDLYRMFSMLYDDYIYGINTQCLTFTGPSARQLIISSDKLITSIRKVTFLFWTVFIFLFPQHTFRNNLELYCISSNNHLTIPFSPTVYTFPWLGSIFHNRKVGTASFSPPLSPAKDQTGCLPAVRQSSPLIQCATTFANIKFKFVFSKLRSPKKITAPQPFRSSSLNFPIKCQLLSILKMNI